MKHAGFPSGAIWLGTSRSEALVKALEELELAERLVDRALILDAVPTISAEEARRLAKARNEIHHARSLIKSRLS